MTVAGVAWVPPVIHYVYEGFLQTHRLLAAAVIVSLWIHVPLHDTKKPVSVYLLVVTCSWASSLILQWALAAYRNVRWQRGNCTVSCWANIRKVSGAVVVELHVPRQCTVHAGQYIYITMPGTSVVGCLQAHPFYVPWSIVQQHETVLFLLVQPRRGFTRRLEELCYRQEKSTRFSAYVQGPFGRQMRLDGYGSIVLVATGIGIAGLLPLLREVLEEHRAWETKVRKLALFWEIESERAFLLSQVEKCADISKTTSTGFKRGWRIYWTWTRAT